jgi:cyclase
VADAVNMPVIASGGAGTLQHLVDAVDEGHASAVAVGSLFHFTDQSPIKARAFMRVAGVDVRSDS